MLGAQVSWRWKVVSNRTFKEQQAFFELATERLPNSGARLEAWNPSRNGAVRYFEQINALYFPCDHEQPRRSAGASVFRIPTVCQALDEERKLPIQWTVYLMGSGFSRHRSVKGGRQVFALSVDGRAWRPQGIATTIHAPPASSQV
jgi:hypothetical protein